MTAVTSELRQIDSEASHSFVLRRLEVFNWGAFCGLHSIDIDPEGTAIVGVTGSGKTTLIDALMTLLAEKPHYNLASSGGHDPDRSLSAYVRGEPGKGSTLPLRRRVLRPSVTTSGISALFEGDEQALCLVALFRYAPSNELHRTWICSQNLKEPLEYWLSLHQASGLKGLKRLERDVSGLQVSASKREYLAGVRRFFDVSDNAFMLLSRAVGVKQLDNLDDLFRKLVLDDVSRFDQARAVADDFNTLIEIHRELVLARQQVQSLEPIAALFNEHQVLIKSLAQHEELHRISPIWYARHEHRLLTQRMASLDQQLIAQEALIRAADGQIQRQRERERTLHEHFIRTGGANIDQLLAHIKAQERIVASCNRAADEYVRLATGAGLDSALDAAAFDSNQGKLPKLRELATEQHRCCRETANTLQAKLLDVRRLRDEVQREHNEMKARPASNIPLKEQRFRAKLGRVLDLEDAQLPFLGELVQVKPEEATWRGAIERALGGQRYRIMVPQKSMPSALDWVNDGHHDIHVRLQQVDEDANLPTFPPDGLTRKLEYKQHPYREAVKRLLAKIDRHCVDSIAQLHVTPFSLTREGLMSGTRGQFEKQDQRHLDEDWATGFNNHDRLGALTSQLQQYQSDLDKVSRQFETAERAAAHAETVAAASNALNRFRFDDIDRCGNQRVLDQLHAQLASLSAPQSETATVKDEWEHAKALLVAMNEEQQNALVKRTEIETHRAVASESCALALTRMSRGLTDRELALAEAHLSAPTASEIDPRGFEAQAQRRIHEKAKEIGLKLAGLEKSLVHLMSNAKQIDNGPLAEVSATIEDLPSYIARLQLLTEEALPAKQKQFLAYLNSSSDQQVTNLLSDIDNEVSRIEERITDLNNTLRRVDFRPGISIRLVPQRVVHERLKSLQQAQKNVRSAARRCDAGESHFEALKELVALLREASDHTASEWARAVLDPRYRLQFAVATIKRDTQELLQLRTGSQGDSGGEKESIACFILISSLGYALCPPGRMRPLFGTVVLDEAFSKTSSGIGSAIMTALHEFGLHPVLVTPNKEFRLLRQHTKTAIVVQHHDGRSMTSWFTWEMLDEINARRQVQ